MSAAITLTGCPDEGGITRLRVEGAFEPTRLDFGEVAVESQKALPVSFLNIGNVEFEVNAIDVPTGFTVRGIKSEFIGSTMQPGADVSFEVVFIPTIEGEANAKLTIQISDDETVELELHGVGTRVRLPNIVAEPTSVDFGTVEVNGEERATITLTNSGNAPGTIERSSFQNMSTEFVLMTPLPITIAEGGSQEIEVAFRPTSQGIKNDRLVLDLVEDVPSVSIALNGEGIIPLGEIVCTPSRVDFGSVERGQTVSRTVTCTARGGAARLIGAQIQGATDQFFLPSPPNTTDLIAEQSFSITVDFVPDGLPSVQNGQLIVDFSGGTGRGTATVQLTGEVVPPPPTATAITVVLSWNTNFTDIDLHLVRPTGSNPYLAMFDLLGDDDCFYANRTPDWNTIGDTSDDPFLDVDDVNGYGPETINLEQTAPGSYDVFVHYFDDSGFGPSTPTVEVHIAGNLAGTFNRPNLMCNEVWHVGTINWNGTNGTFTPSNVIHQSNEGWCF